MGNCVFKSGSRILYDKEDMLIKVVTPNGGVMELHPPILAEFITNEFPGHAIYHNSHPGGSGRHSSPPLLHHEELLAGNIYYLLPLSTTNAATQQSAANQVSNGQTTPYRMSFGSNFRRTAVSGVEAATTVGRYGYRGGGGRGVWKVRLVISPEQLAEILAQEVKTEALIESVRTVAKCGSYGEAAGANSVAGSDQWSMTSSWKLHSGSSVHEDL